MSFISRYWQTCKHISYYDDGDDGDDDHDDHEDQHNENEDGKIHLEVLAKLGYTSRILTG